MKRKLYKKLIRKIELIINQLETQFPGKGAKIGYMSLISKLTPYANIIFLSSIVMNKGRFHKELSPINKLLILFYVFIGFFFFELGTKLIKQESNKVEITKERK